MRAASSGSSASSRTAAARARASPGGTSRPVSPSRTTSATPPWAEATTGRPAAPASIATSPRGSGRVDGTTATSAAAHTSSTSARKPSQRTRSATPRPSRQHLEAVGEVAGARRGVPGHQRHRASLHQRDLGKRADEHVLALPVAHPAHQRHGRPLGGDAERRAGLLAVQARRRARQAVVDHARAAGARELPCHGARDAREGIGPQQSRAHEGPQGRRRRDRRRRCRSRARAPGVAPRPLAPPRGRTSPPRCCRARAPRPVRAPARPARGDRAPPRGPAAPPRRERTALAAGPPGGARAPRPPAASSRSASSPRSGSTHSALQRPGSRPATIASSWRSAPYRPADECRMRTVRVRPRSPRAPSGPPPTAA